MNESETMINLETVEVAGFRINQIRFLLGKVCEIHPEWIEEANKLPVGVEFYE